MVSLNETPIFALDIGTRSVVGMIVEALEQGNYKIKDIQIAEHKSRSMLDGQIHHVVEVAETIKEVKDKLEKKHGPLYKVSVAAAGRALKTKRVTIENVINGTPILRREDIRALELVAIQQAQKELSLEINEATKYHCVGYSVVNYLLDGQVIGSLIDQKGDKVAVEIIATFLPRVVVDSLLSSLTRAGLQMEALTLEPIAAIHVLIPASMRKLNLALIDVGAGTSDIAITADGTITAYGMVPAAGDEITEAISEKFLLDFHNAEKVKRSLSEKEQVPFTDILGVPYHLSSQEIVEQIDQDIERLAKKISQKIIELNNKAPQAVMLVGGGSQTPKLGQKLADLLQISHQRVAIRGIDAVQYKLKWPKKVKNTPELVTPIGIAITTQENPIQYLTIYINDEMIHLFEMKALTVGDALISAGISIKSLFGKPGLAMTLTIDNEIKIIPGKHGTLPSILLNGESATIDTIIKNGDKLNVVPGEDGANATLTVRDALAFSKKRALIVKIAKRELEVYPLAEVNGIDVESNAQLNDRDNLVFKHLQTVEEVLIYHGYSTLPFSQQSITYYLQTEKRNYNYQPKKLYLNDKEIKLNSNIQSGDHISFSEEDLLLPTLKEVLAQEKIWQDDIAVMFNGQPISIKKSDIQVYLNNRKCSLNDRIEPNCNIDVFHSDQPIIFSDIFKYVDIHLESKSTFQLYVNGQEAQFDTQIHHGDQLEIKWQ